VFARGLRNVVLALIARLAGSIRGNAREDAPRPHMVRVGIVGCGVGTWHWNCSFCPLAGIFLTAGLRLPSYSKLHLTRSKAKDAAKEGQGEGNSKGNSKGIGNRKGSRVQSKGEGKGNCRGNSEGKSEGDGKRNS